MSRIIQDTFNLYWAARYGKNKKEIDFKTLAALGKLPEAAGLDDKLFLHDCIGTFGKWLDTEKELTFSDWREISVKGSYLYDKYTQWPEAQSVIMAIVGFLEKESKWETKNQAGLQQRISNFS